MVISSPCPIAASACSNGVELSGEIFLSTCFFLCLILVLDGIDAKGADDEETEDDEGESDLRVGCISNCTLNHWGDCAADNSHDQSGRCELRVASNTTERDSVNGREEK